MKILIYGVAEAKSRFSEILAEAQSPDVIVIITNHGKPVALIIGVRGLSLTEVVMAAGVEQLIELLKGRRT